MQNPLTLRSNGSALRTLLLIIAVGWRIHAADAPLPAADQLKIGGDVAPQEANFTFSGRFKTGGEGQDQILSSRAISRGVASADAFTQTIEFEANRVRGKLKEIVLAMCGEGEVANVQGEALRAWSIRRDRDGHRSLVIRVEDSRNEAPRVTFKIETRQKIGQLPARIAPLIFVPANPALHEGVLRFTATAAVRLRVISAENLTRIEAVPAGSAVPDASQPAGAESMAFRFFAAQPALAFEVLASNPDAGRALFDAFSLSGKVAGDHASFVLKGAARLSNPKGGKLLVLAGQAALTEISEGLGYHIECREATPPSVQPLEPLAQGATAPGAAPLQLVIESDRSTGAVQSGQRVVVPQPDLFPAYYLVFDHAGNFPVELHFDARITDHDGWRSMEFYVAPSSLRPVSIRDLPADSQFRLTSGSDPKRTAGAFDFYLPASGKLAMQWHEARPEGEGRLFYSIESLVEINVGPGLLRQTHLFDVKITQGEMSRVALELAGAGEITRVAGPDILSWKEERTGAVRRLAIELNQAKKADFTIAVYTQTPLGPFPLGVTPIRMRPDHAIRFGGYLRVVNAGAVRLDVTQSAGLSQISPAQFPQTQALRALTDQPNLQLFAYRFSDGAYALTVQADNILPDLSLSELLVYHAGETEAAIDAEFELEVRDAPLREFTVLIPPDYLVTQLNNPHLSDYFIAKDAAGGPSRLRIVFTAPVLGHEIIQARLESNRPLQPGPWTLPRIQPENVKSTRGYLGVASDPGLRLSAIRANDSLVEAAPAFFPRKEEGLQLAWRMRDGDWNAAVGIEHLKLSMQADALHLFSVGEGIAYGSSVTKYFISGSPVATLRFHIPTNYSNLEFAGRDVRGWRAAGPGEYEVSLNSPAFGAYTLLATYDLQFPPQGATLPLDGAQPEGVESEQGRIIVISDFQFQVRPAAVSSGLIALDPAEIPAEDRLLFAAPVLASYQYLARPFNLALQLAALPQSPTMNLVIDRASIQTRVSSEGNALTEIKYLLKSKGHSHLRLALPDGVELWSSMVDHARVIPVADGRWTLFPLPQKSDPDAIIAVDLKLAAKSRQAQRVALELPTAAAPILQTDWRLLPEANHHLIFRRGSFRPASGGVEFTGFEWLRQQLRAPGQRAPSESLLLALALLLAAMALLRWATRSGRTRGDLANIIGLTLAGVAFACALVVIAPKTIPGSGSAVPAPPDITFTTPILDAGSAAAIQIENLENGLARRFVSSLWPLLLALPVWFYQRKLPRGFARAALGWLGWLFVFWAALRAPDGGWLVRLALAAFAIAHFAPPAWKAQRRLPSPAATASASPAVGGAVALLAIGWLALPSQAAGARDFQPGPIITFIEQTARVESDAVLVTARMKWSARPGQWLDFLREPAVLTHIEYPTNQFALLESGGARTAVYRLTAAAGGEFEATFEYQVPVARTDSGQGVTLPTRSGLVNRIRLEVPGEDVEISSPEAVSIQRVLLKKGDQEITHAELALAPAALTQLAWRPRRRDLRTEQPVFYAEINHLLMPGAGVIEGLHQISIRLAQGELAAMEFSVPPQFTITDVAAPMIAAWRFDPDARRLRIQFKSPQSGAFVVRVRSQVAVRPLPYTQALELMTAMNAASQIGAAGIATGNDVQIDNVAVEKLSAINLEDFPRALVAETQSQNAGLVLRRAFRFSGPGAKLTIAASAVQPDVRVATQETLSLAEDRTVLAVNLTANITRAGIFKLSFALPDRLEIESLSGAALSHWTELTEGGQRIVTLHLRGETEGVQSFALTLAGPGLTGAAWSAPRVAVREASKQTGQLVVTPELGIRLHPRARQGVAELDPRQLGIRQPGVLAFRLLQQGWQLEFDVEKVAPWVQVHLLQDVTLKQGQALEAANLEYQIENAGINALRLDLPAGAEGVVFTGQQITDSIRAEPGGNPLAAWTVKLSRRVIGRYLLRVEFKLFYGSGRTNVPVLGIQAKRVNLQRGFLSVRSGGRIEVSAPNLPASLAIADWQSVPMTLRQGIAAQEPNALFRIVEPSFNLNLNIVRHEAAKLLAARVEKVDLTSTLSTAGELLTQAQITLYPGDKRLLRLKLPAGAEFWFAFVNGESALPWKEGDQILIPLEKNSDPNQPAVVEFFYSSRAEVGSARFDYQLPGPEFDLPLQNITWTTYLEGRWRVAKCDERWQLLSQTAAAAPPARGIERYLSVASERRKAKTVQAETLLQKGNEFLQKGDQQMARKAYRAALELSQQDAALNEDARVQLQTLRQQQALVGLNFLNRYGLQQRNQAPGAPNAAAPFQLGEKPTYTQQQAKDFLEQTASEDNAALMRLADRLVRQQDAAAPRAEAIHATLPEQGRRAVFTRSLQVDPWSRLEIKLDIDRSAEKGAPRLALLAAVGLGLAALLLARAKRT